MVFYSACAAIAIIALVLVAGPALRREADESAPDPRQATYKKRLLELERDLADGRIEQQAFEEARLEVARAAVAGSEMADATANTGAAERGLVIAGVVLALALATVTYAFQDGMSSIRYLDAYRALQADDASPESVRTALDTLRALVADDERASPRSWELLGAGYQQTEDWERAHDAYSKALPGHPRPAELMVELADIAAQANGARFGAESLAYLDESLRLEPDNIRARLLRSVAHIQNANYALAVSDLEILEPTVNADSTEGRFVTHMLSRARENLADSEPAQATDTTNADTDS